ncbi:WG repeat-containing protein [Mucilaginibacter sp. E4BP6]|uniref:WG repeat-containing protein n=1 Tax=Mucilaginibacter sp. E4BP6 TaxID=2723089 RepID=UPI0015C82599|nr:WG repeat-containing protein [Mucilaginibacter sp. E4BP6]NYE68416.1 hypothetical protein [Mucilaginibacter sp. E4BP6]
MPPKLQNAFSLLLILAVLFFTRPACTAQSAHTYNKTRSGNVETNGQNTSRASVNVAVEQDPNGIYWGLRNTVTGKLVLNYTYQRIGEFKDGFAMTQLNGKYGLVNKNGKVIVETQFDSPDKIMQPKSGFFAFEVGYGPIVIIDANGKDVVPMTSGVTGILPRQQRMTLGDNVYGMTDFKNDTILPFKFRYTHLLPEGFCVASAFGSPGSGYDNLEGLYDLNGKQILPHVFERIDIFFCGRAIVKKNGKYGVIDEKGKELFYTDYSSIDRYANNYALVHSHQTNGDIKVGIIDKEGKVVVPVIYQWLEHISNFRDGLAAMAQNRKYGFIDTTGRVIVDFKYDKVEPFRDGIAKVWVGWQLTGYIDQKGKEIIPPDFQAMDHANLRRYYDKFIIGTKDSIQHVFDYSGKEIAALKYKTIRDFSQSEISFIVSVDNKMGILDSNFRVKIPVRYQILETIFPGKIAAKERGKFQFIDETGNIISDLKFDAIGPFQNEGMNPYQNGLAQITINRKKGIINGYGKVIIPVIYDNVEGFHYGLAVVKRDGKYGFVNLKGKEVIPAIFSKANAYDGNSAEVSINGKTFNINSLGKRVEEDGDY